MAGVAEFITLTYAPEHLPEGRTLVHRHFQLFMKRLRKRVAPQRFRFFMCGEYGKVCEVCDLSRKRCQCVEFRPTLGRPHYHAILFGYEFPDKRLFKMDRGLPLYTSKILTEEWGMGHCSVGGVTFESAAYVARYVVDKMGGDQAQAHYLFIDEITGECYNRLPEYTKSSNRRGIGHSWFTAYGRELYPDDYVVIRGRRMKVPRYYDKLLKESGDLELVELVKEGRKVAAEKLAADRTAPRLAVRERIQESRAKRLLRSL